MSNSNKKLDRNIFVSVIIPVYNAEKTIADCLNAIYASDYKNFEVIVVDDKSTDQTVSLNKTFPVKVIEMDDNYGPAKARNVGVEATTGEILIFFDADVIIEKDTISKMLESFQSKPEISALFCSFQKNTIQSNFVTEYKNLRHHYTHQISRSDAITFCGGYGAVRRDVFLKLGGFNEDHRVLEDIEFGYRLHMGGYKIFLNKDIQVTHCKTYSFASLVKSDFLDRAIPWTRLMLSNKIFKNDLNVKSNNIISVIVSFILLLNILVLYFFPEAVTVFILLFLYFIFLNRSFFRFILNEKGMVFAFKSILMNWFSYLYSGIGLLVALLGFVSERK